ncbi:MAG TPA: pyridoxal-phosphate dependent enzyme [Bacteroidales bacterium]|nr:pyridoxal-phosphate dependent enzyme [Bacteroidales bacterium]
MKIQHTPTAEDITEAHRLISPYIHETPLLSSNMINSIAGAELILKCENFQKAGAFKSRGAMHAMLQMSPEQRQKGVATHSSGNHAGALARAAKVLGTKAYIVMPHTAPASKVAAVREYGGIITFCEPTLAAREETLSALIEKTGAEEIHPYNNYDIIAGQATAALEALRFMPDPDYILCPVGGGGLLSGTLLTARYFAPESRVIACEPQGANDTWKSFQSKTLVPSHLPKTIADGLLTSLGSRTFPIIMQLVHDVITVQEEEIIRAMRLVWERMKIIIEPSSAVPVAVALQQHPFMKQKKVLIIVSGGNVDLDKLPWNA